MIKKLAVMCIPPIFISALRKFANKKTKYWVGKPKSQSLDLYWDEDFANLLEKWGERTVWKEINLMMAPLKGRVLDVACGTGPVIKILSSNKNLEIFGFDISEKLINRAIEKGINPSRLKIADATKQNYEENEFDYSYSIGSLEHFTEEGVEAFLKYDSLQTRKMSFHMIPTQFYNRNDGWIENDQTYWNNSVEWWMEKFVKHYVSVKVLDSTWAHEGVSLGKWFVCFNEDN